MISGYQAREFGLGLEELLTPSVVNGINLKRKDIDYKSEDDALLINCDIKKRILLMTPVCVITDRASITMAIGMALTLSYSWKM